MEELVFGDIAISLDSVIDSETEAPSFESGYYEATIKQARIKNSQQSNSKALSLTLVIKQELLTKQKINLTKEFDIWFIGKDDNPIEYGVNKIGSMLYILGLPMSISKSNFKDGTAVFNKYDPATNTTKETTEPAYLFTALHDKTINVVIGMKWEQYNENAIKKYDLISFHNGVHKSSKEIKENKEASAYKSRLEYAKKQQVETQQQFQWLIDRRNNQIASSTQDGYGSYGYTETENNAYQNMQNSYEYPQPQAEPLAQTQTEVKQTPRNIDLEQEDSLPF